MPLSTIIGMRMGLEDGVRRPPDQLNVQSRSRAIPYKRRKFNRADAEHPRPRHLVHFYRSNGQLAARRDRKKLLRKARRRKKRRQ